MKDKTNVEKFNSSIKVLVNQEFTIQQLKNNIDFKGSYDELKHFILDLLEGDKGLEAKIKTSRWNPSTNRYIYRIQERD